METKSIAFPAAVPVPELLEKHNYPEWKIRMRTYLRGQDLWEDIINDNDNENENATAADQHDDADHENDVAAAAAAAAAVAAAPSAAANIRRRNYMALHVIQISCGQDAFSEIRTKTTADTAWKTLKDWYLGIRIDQSTPSTSFETRLNIIPNVENGRQRNQVVTIESVPAVLFRHLVLITVRKYLLVPAVRLRDLVSSLLGIKQLYEMKKINIQSEALLSRMCEEISTSLIQTGQPENIDGVYDAINRAVKNGISEFVFKIARMDRSFLENKYKNSRNLLMLAVLYRQSKTFSLIYGLDMKNTLTSYEDRNDNNMLHMTGMIEYSTILNQISGAALQMQRELQWFKGVERIINPKMKEGTNKDGLTPRELFTKNHENMMEKGEKWMKDTSSSCTVVGALIVTIMFAVAFTLPGDFDADEDHKPYVLALLEERSGIVMYFPTYYVFCPLYYILE